MGDATATAAGLFAFYTFLLVAPSLSLKPLAPEVVIWASLVFCVLLPALLAAWVVCNYESRLPYEPAWHPGTDGHTAGANHDFCEENYRYTSYLAEFHNSWSSLPIIFYGGLGPYYTRKHASTELRFSAAFVSIGAVGVGSTLYHGTLLRVGQVLDEVPMLLIIFAGVFCFVEDQRTPRFGWWFPAVLTLLCAALVVGYLSFYMYSLFLGAFSSGVILLLVRGVAAQRSASKLSGRVFRIAAISVLAGFVCWTVDERFCTAVQGLRLHIGWHIGTGFGGYMFTMFLVTLRARVFKKRASLVLPDRWCGSGWRLSEDLQWSECARPEFLLPYVEWSDMA